MDTRTNLLMHRMQICFPDIKFQHLKQKCYNTWSGYFPGFSRDTRFMDVFQTEFGKYNGDHLCKMSKAYRKVFVRGVINLANVMTSRGMSFKYFLY